VPELQEATAKGPEMKAYPGNEVLLVLAASSNRFMDWPRQKVVVKQDLLDSTSSFARMQSWTG
jgi:hypothetical protein